MYPVTPTLSVETFQVRFIWLEDIDVEVRPVGAVGAWVSWVVDAVVKVRLDDWVPLLEASVDFT